MNSASQSRSIFGTLLLIKRGLVYRIALLCMSRFP
jgi:hypothetical protein